MLKEISLTPLCYFIQICGSFEEQVICQKETLKMKNSKEAIPRLIKSIFCNILWFVIECLETIFQNNMHPYWDKARITNEMQVINQIVIGFKESEGGEKEITFMKMLIRHSNNVISRDILPGTASGGITKLIWKNHKLDLYLIL